MLKQRFQYQKSLIVRLYWDYRDRAILRHLKGKKIIDLGCGEGITLEKMVKKLPQLQIMGVDNDPEKIKICRQHHLPVRPADIAHLSFKANTFDCALLVEVIEHLNSKQVSRAIEEVHRILKPGGRLIILFPNDRNFKIGRLLTLKFKEAFYNYGHRHQWSPTEAKKTFRQAGFKITANQGLPFNFWPLSLHHLLVTIAVK